MDKQAPTDLREQVRVALRDQDAVHVHGGAPLDPGIYGPLADAVLVVFAERERLLRERIEALRDEPHTTPPCLRAHTAEDAYRRVLGVFDDES